MPKDDPLTKFVARLIEASKATGRTDAVLADEIFKVAAKYFSDEQIIADLQKWRDRKLIEILKVSGEP